MVVCFEFDLACYNTLRVETKTEFLNAYPIPTSGPLKVSLPSIGYQYAIYTIDGKYLKGNSLW